MRWTSEITNDPNNDYELVVELLMDEEYIGRIASGDGGLVLKVYPRNDPVVIPLPWLVGVFNQAQSDLEVKG